MVNLLYLYCPHREFCSRLLGAELGTPQRAIITARCESGVDQV